MLCRYKPSGLETLKFAWIQYLCMLMPVYALLYWGILGYVLKYGVFQTTKKMA